MEKAAEAEKLKTEQKEKAAEAEKLKTEQKEKAAEAEKQKFDFEVEASKARATREFPELAVAGSELNGLFLDEVKFMHQWKSPELKSSDWPYMLAVKALNKQNKIKGDKLQAEQADRVRVFTVEDLVTLKVIPAKEIQLKGRVTKVSASLLPTKVAQFILDQTVVCEISIPHTSRDEFLFLAVVGEELCSVSKAPSVKGGGPAPRGNPIYRNGQEITIFGLCTRRADGKLAFKITKGNFPWGGI